MNTQHDELEPTQRAAMRALLVDHVRLDAKKSPARATRKRIIGVSAGIGALTAITAGALAIAFTGIPNDSAPALPAPSTSTATPTPTLPPTTTSAPTPTTPPEPGGDTAVTAETAYDECAAAADPWDSVVTTPQGDLPAAPTISLATIDQSDVNEYVEGIWTVVIPVVREHTEGPQDGIKVCTIQGTVENPDVSVTDALD